MRGQKIWIDLDDQPIALVSLHQDLVAAGHCTVSWQTVCKRITKGWEAIDALLVPQTKRGRKTGVNHELAA